LRSQHSRVYTETGERLQTPVRNLSLLTSLPPLLSAGTHGSQVLDDGWLRRGGRRRADPEQLGDAMVA
jgi:hypothetical protein